MRADLDLRLAILIGFGEVFLELDADELPLVSLACQFGGRGIFDDLLEVGVLIG